MSQSPLVPGYALEAAPLDAEPGIAVWKAVHTRTGRAVALTVFTGSDALDWLFLRRTVERLVRLERGHPHLVSLSDADLGADPPYYATELVTGTTLADWTVRNRRPSPEQAVAWITQIAEALSFLHAKGVLHCGLTPGRVRIDAEGQVRVTGAGHRAAVTSVPSVAGGAVAPGTPSAPWTAPEQAAGGEPDVRWDVWALGALAHGLLAGSPPGAAHDLPGADEDLRAIVGRCLERDPALRYQGVGAVLADLRARTLGLPVGPLADRPGYRLKRALRRNKLAMGTGLLVVGGLAVGGWQALRQAESRKGLGLSLLLRAQQAAARSDDAAAAVYAAQSNAIMPSVPARMNALAFLRGIARPLHTFPHRWATGAAELIAFSPDGSRLAIGEEGGRVRIWNTRNGQSAGEVAGLPASVQHVAFTPDGKRLLVALHDGAMQFHDAATLVAASPVMSHPRKILAAAITPDGGRVATAGEDGLARLWDARTGKPVGAPIKHGTPVTFLAMSRDGRVLATAGGQGSEVRIWDSRSGQVLRTIKEASGIYALAFAPDSHTLLVATSDGSARLRDARTGLTIGNALHHRIGIIVAAFTPDGTKVVTGGWDGVVAVWDAATGTPLGEMGRHANGVYQIAVHPDGRRVLSASSDGTVRLWDLGTGNSAGPVMLHEAAIHHAIFSPDGRLIASAGEDGMARLWETDPPRPDERRIAFTKVGFVAARFSDAGDAVAVSQQGGTVECLTISPAGDGSVTRFQAGGSPREAGFLESPGRRLVWTVDWEGAIRSFDPASGAPAGKTINAGGLSAWAFSRDGTKVVTFGYDFNLRVWKLPEGEPLGPVFVHEGGGPVLALSADGARAYSGGYDGMLRSWKVPSGEPIGEAVALEGGPSSLVLSPDGTLALTQCYDGDLRLFSPATWKREGDTMAHPLTASAFAFTPDGTRILSGAYESSVFVWEGRGQGRVGKSFRLPRFVEAVAVAPDSRLGAVASFGGTVHLLDLVTGDPVGPALIAGPDPRALAFGGAGRRLMAASAGDNALMTWDLAGIEAAPAPSALLLRTQVLTHRRVTRDSDIEPIPAEEWKVLATRLPAEEAVHP